MSEIVKYWLGGALLAAVLCAATIPGAHAATDSQAIVQWYAANDHCRGDAIPVEHNPQCKRRDELALALLSRGWHLSPHEVWFNDAEIRAVREAAMQLENMPPMFRSDPNILPRTFYYLRDRGISGEAFVAVYNAHRADLQTLSPFGWAILSELAQRVRDANPNDARFVLDDQ